MTNKIPLWIKIIYTFFLCILAPTYWHYNNLSNFLWFSDLALFGIFLGIWLENSLLVSMMVLAVLLPELIWNINYYLRIISGWHPLNLTQYMFDSTKPIFLRRLSLFHTALPPFLIWLLYRLKYDRRAFICQTIFSWLIMLLVYFIHPHDDVDWVFGLGNKTQTVIPPLIYLGILMLVQPLVVFLPLHFVFKKLFR